MSRKRDCEDGNECLGNAELTIATNVEQAAVFADEVTTDGILPLD